MKKVYLKPELEKTINKMLKGKKFEQNDYIYVIEILWHELKMTADERRELTKTINTVQDMLEEE